MIEFAGLGVGQKSAAADGDNLSLLIVHHVLASIRYRMMGLRFDRQATSGQRAAEAG
jgi:hypothetical protein